MKTLLGKVYTAGETIVQAGETGSCMYVIQRGTVEIVHRNLDGTDVRIGLLQDGELFGEMAIFTKEKRSATVRAVDEAQVLTVDRRTFLRRVKEDPTLAFHLMSTLCQRIRALNEEVAAARQQLDLSHAATERRPTS